MGSDEPQITYGLKEILSDINHKLDAVVAAVSSKADSSRVDQIDERLRSVEASQDHSKRNSETFTRWREWIIPTVATVILAVFTILTYMHG